MKSSLVALLVLIGAGTVSCANPRHPYGVIVSNSEKTAWLGVSVQDVSKSLADKKKLKVDEGAYVFDVVDDSPADEAGIREGDVIVKFDGAKIAGSDELVESVRKTPPKTKVDIEIVRGEEHKTLTATVGREPRNYSYSFGFGDDGIRTPMPPRMPRVRIPRMHFNTMTFSRTESNGLAVQDLTRQLAEYFELPDKKGALVVEVAKGSEAEKAGVKAGDVITKVDGFTVHDASGVVDALDDIKESKDVKIDLVRKGKALTVTMKISARDDDDDESFLESHPRGHSLSRSHWDFNGLDELKIELQNLQKDIREQLRDVRRKVTRDILGS